MLSIKSSGTNLKYYQTFPIERYPGLRCFTLATPSRYAVTTSNCNIILVDKYYITINNVIIPRQTSEYCNRCQMSDYLAIIKLLLFGEPDRGLAPLAPNGALLLEDDALICNHAIPVLDMCHKEQINCMLGHGATMCYFASPHMEQPHPLENYKKRFSSVEQLYSAELNHHMYIDQYLWYNRTEMFTEQHTNHLSFRSTLSHPPSPDAVCYENETLSWPKFIATRFMDIPLKVPRKGLRPIKDTAPPPGMMPLL